MIRIGLLSEGSIDEVLLPSLLDQLIKTIPISGGRRTALFHFPYPSHGYGEIPKNLRLLTKLYQIPSEWERIGCHLIVIIHDSRGTERIQREIQEILRKTRGFPSVYGLAIQEIEAWILGDIENVNRHVFHLKPCPVLPYKPERDSNPKMTLENLFVKPSPTLEYDRWNKECAHLVAPHLRAAQVQQNCPQGFGAFAKAFRKIRFEQKRVRV